MRSRKEFEDRLRMNRTNVAVWLRYAKWEEGQKEIDRARSIYERALDVDYKNVQTWIRYAEMEMRNKFINRVGVATLRLPVYNCDQLADLRGKSRIWTPHREFRRSHAIDGWLDAS